MNASLDFNDVRWLVGPEGAGLLDELSSAPDRLVALARRLERRVPVERVGLLLEQIELRRRGLAKFPAASRMFFRPQALEQATDAAVAAYKAGRFPAGRPLADLCCGIGGDLAELAQRGPVTAVECDGAALVMAEANLRATGGPDRGGYAARFHLGDVAEFSVRPFAAWHLDPDRRAAGRRTTQLDACEPGPATIQRLLGECPHAAIKLAPATEVPAAWEADAEREWISRDRHCRQQVAWFGSLAENPGRRRATVLRTRQNAAPAVATLVGEANLLPPIASAPGRYLLEPDPAVLAAGLTGALALRHGLSIVHPAVPYLTGDRPVADLCGQCFEVTDELPFDRKRLKALLRQRAVGRLEIKLRGVGETPEQIRRSLKLRGSEEAVLLVARLGRRVVAILARRI